MTELTKEQIAKAARVVTGLDCFVETEDGADYVITPNEGIWHPSFSGTHKSRHQAFQVVEYLSEKITTRFPFLRQVVGDKDELRLIIRNTMGRRR